MMIIGAILLAGLILTGLSFFALIFFHRKRWARIVFGTLCLIGLFPLLALWLGGLLAQNKERAAWSGAYRLTRCTEGELDPKWEGAMLVLNDDGDYTFTLAGGKKPQYEGNWEPVISEDWTLVELELGDIRTQLFGSPRFFVSNFLPSSAHCYQGEFMRLGPEAVQSGR